MLVRLSVKLIVYFTMRKGKHNFSKLQAFSKIYFKKFDELKIYRTLLYNIKNPQTSPMKSGDVID